MGKKKKQETGKFTVVAKLNPAQNQEIIDAFDKETHAFNQAKIMAFHHIRKLNMAGMNFDDDARADLRSELQKKFHILSRTANFIITEASTIWEMNMEAKKTALEQDEAKLESITEEIKELTEKKELKKDILLGNKPLKRRKKESDEQYESRVKARFDKIAEEQKNLRKKLVSKKMAKDRLKTRIQKQEAILETKNLRICFGTKELQAKDPEAFKAHRDSQMTFIGSYDEPAQNQIFQLSPCKSGNRFDIRMRRDFYEKPEIIETKTTRHRATKTKPA